MLDEITLEEIHWLLIVSRSNLPYSSQREMYNQILAKFKAANVKAIPKEVKQDDLKPLSLTGQGVYND